MASNIGVEFFLKFLNERQNALINASNKLLSDLVGDDAERKKIAAKNMLQAAMDLRSALPISDVPQWLVNVMEYLQLFVNGTWGSAIFVEHYVKLRLDIQEYRWAIDSDDVEAFNFDAIFEHYKKQSRLPELFDVILNILEEIKNSGEVDSVTMVNSLGKVIATIKKCKDGSYFSLNSAWAFLLSFLENYLWGELSNLPLLGSAFEALKKTIDETNEEMKKVHTQVATEMQRVVESEIRPLGGKSAFPFVSYSKNGSFAKNPDEGSIIDVEA